MRRSQKRFTRASRPCTERGPDALPGRRGVLPFALTSGRCTLEFLENVAAARFGGEVARPFAAGGGQAHAQPIAINLVDTEHRLATRSTLRDHDIDRGR